MSDWGLPTPREQFAGINSANTKAAKAAASSNGASSSSSSSSSSSASNASSTVGRRCVRMFTSHAVTVVNGFATSAHHLMSPSSAAPPSSSSSCSALVAETVAAVTAAATAPLHESLEALCTCLVMGVESYLAAFDATVGMQQLLALVPSAPDLYRLAAVVVYQRREQRGAAQKYQQQQHQSRGEGGAAGTAAVGRAVSDQPHSSGGGGSDSGNAGDPLRLLEMAVAIEKGMGTTAAARRALGVVNACFPPTGDNKTTHDEFSSSASPTTTSSSSSSSIITVPPCIASADCLVVLMRCIGNVMEHVPPSTATTGHHHWGASAQVMDRLIALLTYCFVLCGEEEEGRWCGRGAGGAAGHDDVPSSPSASPSSSCIITAFSPPSPSSQGGDFSNGAAGTGAAGGSISSTSSNSGTSSNNDSLIVMMASLSLAEEALKVLSYVALADSAGGPTTPAAGHQAAAKSHDAPPYQEGDRVYWSGLINRVLTILEWSSRRGDSSGTTSASNNSNSNSNNNNAQQRLRLAKRTFDTLTSVCQRVNVVGGISDAGGAAVGDVAGAGSSSSPAKKEKKERSGGIFSIFRKRSASTNHKKKVAEGGEQPIEEEQQEGVAPLAAAAAAAKSPRIIGGREQQQQEGYVPPAHLADVYAVVTAAHALLSSYSKGRGMSSSSPSRDTNTTIPIPISPLAWDVVEAAAHCLATVALRLESRGEHAMVRRGIITPAVMEAIGGLAMAGLMVPPPSGTNGNDGMMMAAADGGGLATAAVVSAADLGRQLSMLSVLSCFAHCAPSVVRRALTVRMRRVINNGSTTADPGNAAALTTNCHCFLRYVLSSSETGADASEARVAEALSFLRGGNGAGGGLGLAVVGGGASSPSSPTAVAASSSSTSMAPAAGPSALLLQMLDNPFGRQSSAANRRLQQQQSQQSQRRGGGGGGNSSSSSSNPFSPRELLTATALQLLSRCLPPIIMDGPKDQSTPTCTDAAGGGGGKPATSSSSVAAAPPHPPPVSMLMPRTWQWEDDLHNYSSYPSGECTALEMALLANKHPRVVVKSGGRHYAIDLTGLRQERGGGGGGGGSGGGSGGGVVRNVQRSAVPFNYAVVACAHRYSLPPLTGSSIHMSDGDRCELAVVSGGGDTSQTMPSPFSRSSLSESDHSSPSNHYHQYAREVLNFLFSHGPLLAHHVLFASSNSGNASFTVTGLQSLAQGLHWLGTCVQQIVLLPQQSQRNDSSMPYVDARDRRGVVGRKEEEEEDEQRDDASSLVADVKVFLSFYSGIIAEAAVSTITTQQGASTAAATASSASSASPRAAVPSSQQRYGVLYAMSVLERLVSLAMLLENDGEGGDDERSTQPLLSPPSSPSNNTTFSSSSTAAAATVTISSHGIVSSIRSYFTRQGLSMDGFLSSEAVLSAAVGVGLFDAIAASNAKQRAQRAKYTETKKKKAAILPPRNHIHNHTIQKEGAGVRRGAAAGTTDDADDGDGDAAVSDEEDLSDDDDDDDDRHDDDASVFSAGYKRLESALSAFEDATYSVFIVPPPPPPINNAGGGGGVEGGGGEASRPSARDDDAVSPSSASSSSLIERAVNIHRKALVALLDAILMAHRGEEGAAAASASDGAPSGGSNTNAKKRNPNAQQRNLSEFIISPYEFAHLNVADVLLVYLEADGMHLAGDGDAVVGGGGRPRPSSSSSPLSSAFSYSHQHLADEQRARSDLFKSVIVGGSNTTTNSGCAVPTTSSFAAASDALIRLLSNCLPFVASFNYARSHQHNNGSSSSSSGTDFILVESLVTDDEVACRPVADALVALTAISPKLSLCYSPSEEEEEEQERRRQQRQQKKECNGAADGATLPSSADPAGVYRCPKGHLLTALRSRQEAYDDDNSGANMTDQQNQNQNQNQQNAAAAERGGGKSWLCSECRYWPREEGEGGPPNRTATVTIATPSTPSTATIVPCPATAMHCDECQYTICAACQSAIDSNRLGGAVRAHLMSTMGDVEAYLTGRRDPTKVMADGVRSRLETLLRTATNLAGVPSHQEGQGAASGRGDNGAAAAAALEEGFRHPSVEQHLRSLAGPERSPQRRFDGVSTSPSPRRGGEGGGGGGGGPAGQGHDAVVDGGGGAGSSSRHLASSPSSPLGDAAHDDAPFLPQRLSLYYEGVGRCSYHETLVGVLFRKAFGHRLFSVMEAFEAALVGPTPAGLWAAEHRQRQREAQQQQQHHDGKSSPTCYLSSSPPVPATTPTTAANVDDADDNDTDGDAMAPSGEGVEGVRRVLFGGGEEANERGEAAPHRSSSPRRSSPVSSDHHSHSSFSAAVAYLRDRTLCLHYFPSDLRRPVAPPAAPTASDAQQTKKAETETEAGKGVGADSYSSPSSSSPRPHRCACAAHTKDAMDFEADGGAHHNNHHHNINGHRTAPQLRPSAVESYPEIVLLRMIHTATTMGGRSDGDGYDDAYGSGGGAPRFRTAALAANAHLVPRHQSNHRSHSHTSNSSSVATEAAFISKAVTERVIKACVASALRVALLDPQFAIPRWAYFLLTECGFLFPLEVRRRLAMFLAFGARRRLWEFIFDERLTLAADLKGNVAVYPCEWIRVPLLGASSSNPLVAAAAAVSAAASGGSGSSGSGSGASQSTRHVVDRRDLLRDALRVVLETAEMRFPIAIEYAGEKGTGTGPTVAFYTDVAKELCRARLGIWRQQDEEDTVVVGGQQHQQHDQYGGGNAFVAVSKEGLFPSILSPQQMAAAGKSAASSSSPSSSSSASSLLDVDALFYVVGAVMARSYMDGRLFPLALSTVVLEYLRHGLPWRDGRLEARMARALAERRRNGELATALLQLSSNGSSRNASFAAAAATTTASANTQHAVPQRGDEGGGGGGGSGSSPLTTVAAKRDVVQAQQHSPLQQKQHASSSSVPLMSPTSPSSPTAAATAVAAAQLPLPPHMVPWRHRCFSFSSSSSSCVLRRVDAGMLQSVECLGALYAQFRHATTVTEKADAEIGLESLGIPFAVPGYDDVEGGGGGGGAAGTDPSSPSPHVLLLCPDGAQRVVDVDNFEEFRGMLTVAMAYGTVHRQVRSLVRGFTDTVPSAALRVLGSAEELSRVLCGSDDDVTAKVWPTEASLRPLLQPDHGYSADSRQIHWLVSIVATHFSPAQQRQFLEFCTGCPRVPIGGLGQMGRITVVYKEPSAAAVSGGGGGNHNRAPSSSSLASSPSSPAKATTAAATADDAGPTPPPRPGTADATLVSVNTCFLYLKVPAYSSLEWMKERLLQSIYGSEGFDFS